MPEIERIWASVLSQLKANGGVVKIGVRGLGGDKDGANPDFKRGIENKLGGLYVQSKYHAWIATRAVDFASNGTGKIELWGYSMGGTAAAELTNQVNKDASSISALYLLDPVKILPGDLVLTAKVGPVTTWYQRQPTDKYNWLFLRSAANIMWGDPVVSNVEGNTVTNNLITTKHSYIPACHFDPESYPAICSK